MFTHKDLIPIAYKWVLKSGSCGVAFKELNTHASNGEYPDVIGFGSWGRSVLIEVKVSRSDFLADRKKTFRKYPEHGMGRFRFYMSAVGLIKPDDLPANWGLVYVDEQGKAACFVNLYCVSSTGNIWSGAIEVKNYRAEAGMMYSALQSLHLKEHVERACR